MKFTHHQNLLGKVLEKNKDEVCGDAKNGGKDIYMIISPVETLAIELEIDAGKIEVNIGLEM